MTSLSSVSSAELVAELRRRRDEIDAVLSVYGTETDIIEQAVSAHFSISNSLLHDSGRSSKVTLPRHAAMTLMRESGMTWADVESHFKKSNGTGIYAAKQIACLLYTSPSPRDQRGSRMPSSA